MTLLGDLMAVRSGSVNPASFPDEEFELYSIPAHDRGGPEFVRGSEIGSSKQLVEPGDVMIAKIIPHIRRARVVGAKTARRQIASGEWIVFRGDDFESAYLRHFLVSEGFHQRFMNSVAGVGGSLIRARPQLVKAIPVPLPPLKEQRRIAAILDNADSLRAKRSQTLTLIDSLERSIFVAMFHGYPAAATVSEIVTSTAASIRTGPFGSQLLHSEFVDDGVAVLGLDNVVGNEFRWVERRFITLGKYEQLARYTVHPGDVLISIMGTTGRCVVVPDDIPTAINTKHICAITVDHDQVTPVFLRAAFLWHPESRAHLKRQTKGAVMDGLNMGIIKSMPVPVPPIAAQRDFGARIAAVSAHRLAMLEVGDKNSELFTSLQARAFRGDL